MKHSLQFSENGRGQLYWKCECTSDTYEWTATSSAFNGFYEWMFHVDTAVNT